MYVRKKTWILFCSCHIFSICMLLMTNHIGYYLIADFDYQYKHFHLNWFVAIIAAKYLATATRGIRDMPFVTPLSNTFVSG